MNREYVIAQSLLKQAQTGESLCDGTGAAGCVI